MKGNTLFLMRFIDIKWVGISDKLCWEHRKVLTESEMWMSKRENASECILQ